MAPVLKPTVEELIEALSSPNYRVRWQAARDLGKRGDPRAIEPLMLALKDKTITVRAKAIKALGRMGAAEAAERIFELTRHPVHRIHLSACDALTELSTLALPTLAKFLAEGDEDQRWTAAFYLGVTRSSKAIPFLEAALDDPSALVRRAVSRALEAIAELPPPAIPPIRWIEKDGPTNR